MWLRPLVLSLACALTPLFGCTSTPTLPLPPPVAVVHAPTAQGLVMVEGEANVRAFVSVFNQHTEAGRITRADMRGHFQVEIEASVGDTLVIWQERDGLTGERTEQNVPAPSP